MTVNQIFISVLCLLTGLFGFGCNRSFEANPTTQTSQQQPATSSNPPDTGNEDPVNVMDHIDPKAFTQILLFNGRGISTSDWQSTEQIVQSMNLSYRLVNSAALSAFTLEELKNFGLILIPGGNSNTINNGLSIETRIRVRQAVRDGGVSYLGICAGAFAGVGTDTASNTTAHYGFAVALGEYLSFWYPNGNSSKLAAVPLTSFADGSKRYLTWYGGPGTPEWKNGVIARYPDGRAAISQTWTQNALVILSGVHPEAPSSWQSDSGPDPDGLDHDIAVKLIRAALEKKALPVF